MKDFPIKKLSNKEIHFTLQSDNTTHEPFQFISWLNFIEGFQNLSPGIWGKVLNDYSLKCSDGYIFHLDCNKFAHFSFLKHCNF